MEGAGSTTKSSQLFTPSGSLHLVTVYLFVTGTMVW
jgi:hypothetical protein